MKRILSFILSAIMIVSCFAVTTFADSAAVSNVESLINAIGEVKYHELSEAQEYSGMNFVGEGGDGYSQFGNNGENPANAYSVTLYFSLNSSKPGGKIAAFTGYGVSAGYSFSLGKFYVSNDISWPGIPNSVLAAKEYELETGVLYKMTLSYGDVTAVYLNDNLMCSVNTGFTADSYNIFYPQNCDFDLQRFVYEENGTVVEDISGATNLMASTCFFARGDKYTAKDSFTAQLLSDSGSAIESAEAAYAALSDDDKAAVSNYETLTSARSTYDGLAASAFDALVDAIGEVTLEGGDAKIVAAEKAYGKMTDAQKALVTKYDALTAARAQYDLLAIVGKLETSIDGLEGLDPTDTTPVGGGVHYYESSLGYINNGEIDGVISGEQYLDISYDLYVVDYTLTADPAATNIACITSAFGETSEGATGYDFFNKCFFVGKMSGVQGANIEKVYASAPFELNPGEWYHIETIYEDSSITIVCDGITVLEHTYDSAPNHKFVIYSSKNLKCYVDNFIAEDWDGNTYQFVGEDNENVDATTYGDVAKAKINNVINAYKELSVANKCAVSNFDKLKTAAASVGVTLLDPAEEVIGMINSIGEVYYDYSETKGTYDALTFDQTVGAGYSQLDQNPVEQPYSLTFTIIPQTYSKDYTKKSSFGMFSNGGGGAVYDFCEQRFVITNDAFNYNGYNSDYAASEVIELKPGTKYEVKFLFGASKTAIFLNGEEVCNSEKVIWNGYCIIYPQDCKVTVLDYTFAKEDGTVINSGSTADFDTTKNGEGESWDPQNQWIAHNPGWTYGKADEWVYFDSNDAISAAEEAYAQLSPEYKEKVTNYDVLTAARVAYDKKPAEAVDALIGEIGAVSLEAGDAKIVAAEKAYDALSDAQRAYVTAYDTLVAAREEYEFYVDVAMTQGLIDKLGGMDLDKALADETAVGGDVYAADLTLGYNSNGDVNDYFAATQYMKISMDVNYSSYTVTEDKMSTYMGSVTNGFGDLNQVAAGYDFANQRFIIGRFTHIQTAKIDYVVAEAHVKLLPNTWYNIVVEYDDRTVNIYCDGALVLTYTYENAPNHTFIIYSSNNVNLKLDNAVCIDCDDATYTLFGSDNATTDETTLGAEAAKKIQTAVDYYNALPAAGQEMITNFDVLEAAAKKIGIDFTDPAVEAVIAGINNIGVVALPKLDKINAVKTAYDALSDAQKAKVTNADVLTAAIEKYNELNNTDWAVKKVESQINGLAGITEGALKDDTAMRGVMIQFREVVDGDRYPGYSNFGDKAADKLRADKSFTYEFDINVYDYDAVNGFPAFNGYTNAVNFANGYDFLNGRFYVADYDAMGTGNSMDNGCIGTVYAEAKVDFTLGVWHHYKVVYNGNNITINFDGVDVINYTAPEDAEIPYNYYIQYPQWINCDLANMVFTAADGTTVKAPIDKDSFTSGGGTNAITMEATTVGAENKKSIEAAYEAYKALTDAQKEQVSNLDTLKSALALIGVEFGGGDVLLGDANEDGKVDMKDVNRIIRYCANWDVEINLANADYNQDGKVNLKDVNALIRLEIPKQ